VRTLTFPLAATTMEFLATFGNAFGTAGSTAYSQYANLPLLQLVSVTGIWGLTFLVSWLAPVVNEIWEGGLRRRRLAGESTPAAGRRAAVALFCLALAGASLFGGIRLAFAAPDAATVRVAAVAPHRGLSESAYSAPRLRPGVPAERRADQDERFALPLDDLFERSTREARAGARIVAWSEAAALVLAEDREAVIQRVAQLAAQQRIYLQISMIMLLDVDGTDGGPVNENHAVMLGPTGMSCGTTSSPSPHRETDTRQGQASCL